MYSSGVRTLRNRNPVHLFVGHDMEGVLLGGDLFQPAPRVELEGPPWMPIALLVVVHNPLPL